MDLRQLCEEIGRQLGVSLTLDSAGLARLMVDGRFSVDFELDSPQDRLLVYSSIGLPPAGAAREALYGELLAAHLFGQATEGCAPALDSERNELLLWLQFGPDSDVHRASTAIEALLAQVAHWQQRLSTLAASATLNAPGAAPSAPAATESTSFMPPDMGMFLRA